MHYTGVIMRVIPTAMLAVVLAQAACRSPTEPAGLRVITEVAPATFRQGTEVVITITVINAGVRPRVFQANLCTGFEVMTPAGQVVGPAGTDCDGSIVAQRLLPGERMVFTTRWAGEGPGETMLTTAPLPPGQYFLRTRIGVINGDFLTSSRHVASKPVAITVTP